MSLPFRSVVAALFVASVAGAEPGGLPTTQPTAEPLVLHIAADPNNLPFSNSRGEGFENKIAELVARDLGAKIDYVWWAQRRGFFRDAVKHGQSDVVMGVPSDFERMVPTKPYYRSTYVFVYRKDRGIHVHSFDDPELRTLKIGVPLVGGSNNSPPAQALAGRGIVNNIVGYTLYNDYRQDNPSSEIVTAVTKGDIDVAVVWGPLGAYFAARQDPPLAVVPVGVEAESSTPFAYSISIGVKRSQKELKQRIDQILTRRAAEMDRILDEYGVPRLPLAAKTPEQSDAKASTK
jgi:mxaJ protein